MDDVSRSSSVSKAPSAEESGWTVYFDDFFASSQKREEAAAASGDCSSVATAGCGDGGSSMISDAASCAAWKVHGPADQSQKKLSFRKRKTGPAVDDDSLEDTASSPVNSPKVLQEKGIGCENFREVLKGDAIDELGFTDETVNECTDLKKKGLCLVPMSMLVDYLA